MTLTREVEISEDNVVFLDKLVADPVDILRDVLAENRRMREALEYAVKNCVMCHGVGRVSIGLNLQTNQALYKPCQYCEKQRQALADIGAGSEANAEDGGERG
ncbi:hypothetical protein [Alicyclobacillus suci]|uniref:hypothetical protein n=1 Tax=Alicyclobacillus suci TaxID=2816080 RepID=UPI001A8F4D0E|nr:hypothetical protein [Alicyclobacillus suci]